MKKTISSKIWISVLFIFISIIFICCNNNDDDPPDNNNNNNPPAGSYYIRAKVNGTLVEASYSPANSDIVSNAYHTDDKRFQIQRYLSSGTSQGYNISVDDIDLDQITYPKTLAYSGYFGLPMLDVFYNNGTDGASGNFVINNLDSTLFSLTLSSYISDVLSGTFSGKLRWGSDYDSTLTFTDGEFKAKLIRV
jgi:hypothetical protein